MQNFIYHFLKGALVGIGIGFILMLLTDSTIQLFQKRQAFCLIPIFMNGETYYVIDMDFKAGGSCDIKHTGLFILADNPFYSKK